MNARRWLGLHATAVLLVVSAGAYLFIVATNLNKPFTTDEVYYAGWAHGIAEAGAPRYYSGEILTVGGRSLVEPLSHPPLHFILLAGLIRVFGLSYWSLRLLGVLMLAAAAVFVVRWVRKELTWGLEPVVLTFLLLVFNPLFVQQSLVLAIEGQAFWFPALVFLFAFFVETRRGRRFFLYPASTFAMVVLFWFKETNIVTYLSACLAFLVLFRRFRAVPHLVLATALAVGLFWLTWVVYCAVTGVDVYSWWQFTVKHKLLSNSYRPYPLQHFLLAGDFAGAWQAVARGFRYSVIWTSAPWTALFFLALGVRIRDLWRRTPAPPFIDLCLLYALSVLAFAKIVRPSEGFLKYEVPAHFFAAFFMADTLYRRLNVRGANLLLGVAFGLACSVLGFFVLPDRLLQEGTLWLHLTQAAAVTGAGWAIYALIQGHADGVLVVPALVGALVALNGALIMHQAGDYTTGVSWYNYGDQRGKAIAWLREHLDNGDAFAAFKDIQFDMRFVEGKTASKTYEVRTFTRDRSNARAKKALLASRDIRFLVFCRYSAPRARLGAIESRYHRVWRRGDLEIYERNPEKHLE